MAHGHFSNRKNTPQVTKQRFEAAKDDYEADKRLFDEGFKSKTELLDSLSNLEEARLNYEKSLNSENRSLLTTPIDGVILSLARKSESQNQPIADAVVGTGLPVVDGPEPPVVGATPPEPGISPPAPDVPPAEPVAPPTRGSSTGSEAHRTVRFAIRMKCYGNTIPASMIISLSCVTNGGSLLS